MGSKGGMCENGLIDGWLDRKRGKVERDREREERERGKKTKKKRKEAEEGRREHLLIMKFILFSIDVCRYFNEMYGYSVLDYICCYLIACTFCTVSACLL